MKKLSNRNKLLLVGIIALSLLSYELSIKKTLNNYSEYREAKSLEELGSTLPLRLQTLRQQEGQLDKQLKSFNASGKSHQSSLLKFLNQQIVDTQVSIQEFVSPHQSAIGEDEMKTYQFTLKGDFIGTLKVIHSLEKKKGFGAVTHIEFKKVKNYRSGKRELLATVLLSHLE